MLRKTLYRWLLPDLLSKACESTIPRSGEEGASVNCFVVYLDKNSEPFFIATEYDGDILRGLRWDDDSYAEQHAVALEDIDKYDLKITHYYGIATITYNSIYDFAFHHVTRLEYLKIRFIRYLETTHQYFFNKRKLVTKKRMELLEFMMNDQLDRGHNGIRVIDLMTKLYSINWVVHPSKEEQRRKLMLYLESLVESGELKNINGKYVVTGQAIITLERYEEEERRHSESVKLQRKMVWLTVLIVFMAMVQAGLIKFPPLLDFSSSRAEAKSHNNQIQPTQNPRG